jgi:polar amino acid transport system substrate-binding protein
MDRDIAARLLSGEALVMLDTDYAYEDYAVAVGKDNAALLDRINGALAELKASGAIKDIVERYKLAE